MCYKQPDYGVKKYKLSRFASGMLDDSLANLICKSAHLYHPLVPFVHRKWPLPSICDCAFLEVAWCKCCLTRHCGRLQSICRQTMEFSVFFWPILWPFAFLSPLVSSVVWVFERWNHPSPVKPVLTRNKMHLVSIQLFQPRNCDFLCPKQPTGYFCTKITQGSNYVANSLLHSVAVGERT